MYYHIYKYLIFILFRIYVHIMAILMYKNLLLLLLLLAFNILWEFSPPSRSFSILLCCKYNNNLYIKFILERIIDIDHKYRIIWRNGVKSNRKSFNCVFLLKLTYSVPTLLYCIVCIGNIRLMNILPIVLFLFNFTLSCKSGENYLFRVYNLSIKKKLVSWESFAILFLLLTLYFNSIN